jgi:hypothetical protein
MIGDHLGDLQTLVDHYLPKPAIDRATIRMAKLLRDRFGGGEPRTGAAGEAELPDGGQPA